MNTIEQLYYTLPEPARSRALVNLKPLMKDKKVENVQDALIVGFFWEYTPEGYNYWQGVFNAIHIRR